MRKKRGLNSDLSIAPSVALRASNTSPWTGLRTHRSRWDLLGPGGFKEPGRKLTRNLSTSARSKAQLLFRRFRTDYTGFTEHFCALGQLSDSWEGGDTSPYRSECEPWAQNKTLRSANVLMRSSAMIAGALSMISTD